jgi:hypothetical protein
MVWTPNAKLQLTGILRFSTYCHSCVSSRQNSFSGGNLILLTILWPNIVIQVGRIIHESPNTPAMAGFRYEVDLIGHSSKTIKKSDGMMNCTILSDKVALRQLCM